MSSRATARPDRPEGDSLRLAVWALASCLLVASAGCGPRDREAGVSADSTITLPAARPPDAAPAPAAGRPSPPRGKDRDEVAAGKRASGAAGRPSEPAPAGKRPAKGRKGASEALRPPALAVVAPAEELSTEQLRSEVIALRAEHEDLRRRVAALTPRDPYILINTTLNRLSMKAGDRFIVQDAIVSTGSNTQLVEPNGQRRWFFSTPKGVHTVKRKMVAPVWVKPDWAFIEEGEPVPGAQAEARFEEGTLGRYALYFGNGYMIHGTLFQRFLGQSVTHGCVRVGDADLEALYENSKVGTKIYIY